MITTNDITIQQVLPNKRNKLKQKVLRNQLVDSLSTYMLTIEEPTNATYKLVEMNTFLHCLISEEVSGNLSVDLVYDNFGFNHPDQQTVSDRIEKPTIKDIEKNFNKHVLENASELPTFRSDLQLRKVKEMVTKRRREEASRRQMLEGDEIRPRQRERGIDPPPGRYLSLDFTLKPFYTDKFDEYNEEDHEIADHLTKNRSKASTSKFMGYHTVYDHEFGSRQILSVHILTRVKMPNHKNGRKREGLGDVVESMMDPIIEKIEVEGVAGYGDYYNLYVISYLEANSLDYVIKATMSPNIRNIIEENYLEKKLEDGQEFEVEKGLKMTISNTSEPSPEMRLVIVKHGEKLVPLVLPGYSEMTPKQALLVYEERFGIETSYREVYKYLPQTSSLTPQYRLALYSMTCWFLNILFNYYQIVVLFLDYKEKWDVTLSRLKGNIKTILGDILRESVG